MIFRRIGIAIALLCLCGCEKGPPPDVGIVRTPGGAAPIRIAMVVDAAPTSDAPSNISAAAGLRAAQRKLGAETQVLTARSAADYVPQLTALANQNYDEVVAASRTMVLNVARIARNYPKRHFAILDAVVDEPNVSSLTFREQEGAFLAGALAAMMSKSRAVGVLGDDAEDSARLAAGFAAGAREIDPAARVIVRIGSNDVATRARTIARAIYAQGADVLFVTAGDASGAYAETRARRNAYAIAVGIDDDAIAPGRLLTSVLKRSDVAVFKLAEATQSQKIPAGHLEYGLAGGGVALADFAATRRAIGRARIARLAALQAAIVARKIVPPATREALATFKSMPL